MSLQLAKSMFDGKEGIPLVDVDEFCPPDQDNTENCATHYDFSSMFCVRHDNDVCCKLIESYPPLH